MLSKSDILINYFPHMKNWLILHVTLGPSCALCIAKLVERARRRIKVSKVEAAFDKFQYCKVW